MSLSGPNPGLPSPDAGKLTDNSSVALFASFGTSTNPRIGNVAKLGAALRYEF